MRLKRSNAGVRVCVLAPFVVLLLTAVVAAPASALNPERHYEMVSPVFKGGFGASEIGAVSADGNAVGYTSAGAFNGAPSGGVLSMDYLARRGAGGWSSVPLMTPTSLLPEQGVKDMSPGLDLVLQTGSPGANSQSSLLEKTSLLLHPTSLPDTAAGWEVVAELEAVDKKEEGGINYVQSSVDFCHVFLYSRGVLLAEASGGQLYEIDRGCGSAPASVALVGLNNKEKLISGGCRAEAGIEELAEGDEGGQTKSNLFNAISSDGSEVFFTGCTGGTVTEGTPQHQLFLRLGGSRTLEVSRPLEPGRSFGGCAPEVLPGEVVPGEVPCQGALTRASADFTGASRDGSKVYFKTSAPLTATDTDASRDIYLATIGCPAGKPECQAAAREVTSLTQVSRDPNGGAAEVRGVVRVAPDGQRAYFVAGGDLLSSGQRQALEGKGRPVPHPGAENLYVYDASAGTTAFVGDLCSGKETSGTVEDIRCPSTEADTLLWSGGGGNAGESQTAGSDGRFLVFASYAQLARDDTNVAKDVYRYDAETGALERVSTGEDGFDANGNGTNGGLGAQIAEGHYGGNGGGASGVLLQYEMNNRAISEDGSRIVFSSAEPLSPAATNGLVNAYEWHAAPDGGEGTVSLVSPGNDQQPINFLVMSPSGADIFFVTATGLVPQDTDNDGDVYDARLGGGFSQAPAERRPCEGDACQGPLTNPAPLLVPGSVAQEPGGNFAAPAPAATVKAKTIPKCSRGKKRSHGTCIKTTGNRKTKANKVGHKRRNK
jgi:hypothetical protein